METEETFAGIAWMSDGTTQIISGTLIECTKWADDIMQSGDIKEIDIRRVEQ